MAAQVYVMLGVVLAAILIVVAYRKQRDRAEVAGRLAEMGGSLMEMVRLRRGHPFADTGRGWWVWRVRWTDAAGEHTAFVLTTREGLKEWRD